MMAIFWASVMSVRRSKTLISDWREGWAVLVSR